MVKLISESYVKPKFGVGATKYHLGPIDLSMLSLDFMQKGLLYTKPSHQPKMKPNNMINSFLKNLKASLSEALVYYYPFAGRFETKRFESEHSCLIFVDCNKGPGARIIHATALDLSVSDILSPIDTPLVVRSFFDLGERGVNHDGHTRPLLSIQVTELIDGVFMGFTVNHCIADGTSLWNFVAMLSGIFQANNVTNYQLTDEIPILRAPNYKSFFPKKYGTNPTLKLPYLHRKEFIVRFQPNKLRERIFHFSSTSMAMLKAKANKECGTQDISSFQALSALVWRSITRARKQSLNQGTTCVLIANARPRMVPPYSQYYFGNFLTRARSHSKVHDLLDRGLGFGAMLINQAVKEQDDKSIRDFIDSYVANPFVCHPGGSSAFYEPNSVLIGGSPRFDMFGAEFGLGKPIAVRNGFDNKDDGKLTANPGRSGGGSVDLEVCLKPQTMAALETDKEFMSFSC